MQSLPWVSRHSWAIVLTLPSLLPAFHSPASLGCSLQETQGPAARLPPSEEPGLTTLSLSSVQDLLTRPWSPLSWWSAASSALYRIPEKQGSRGVCSHRCWGPGAVETSGDQTSYSETAALYNLGPGSGLPKILESQWQGWAKDLGFTLKPEVPQAHRDDRDLHLTPCHGCRWSPSPRAPQGSAWPWLQAVLIISGSTGQGLTTLKPSTRNSTLFLDCYELAFQPQAVT